MNLKKLRLLSKHGPQRRILKLFIAVSIGLFLSLEASGILELFDPQPVSAQSLRVEQIAAQVYDRLPYLPKENNYVSQETGEVEPNNTLVSRLIRYHQSIKNRPINFRLDWKLTLADYLGANEPIKESQYPGSSLLKENPFGGDRTAISNLNRRQRSELIDVLVSIYNPQPKSSSNEKPSKPETSKSSSQSGPSLPQPGDAQLLAP